MLKYLLPLVFKKASRSSIWQKNMAVNILIGFFMFILLAEFLLLGIFLDKILLEFDPDGAPEMLIEKSLIYYYLILFLMRFYMQNLPSVDIGQLLHLPLVRSKIASYVHLRSLTSLFNFIPFILFFPFALIYMWPEYGFAVAFVWFLAILFFDLTSNFLLLYVKRKSNNNLWIFFGLVGVLSLVALLENYSIYSFGNLSLNFFETLQKNLWLIVVPSVSLIGFLFLSHKYLISNSYLENLPNSELKKENLSEKFNKLDQWGQIGSLVLNEIRLLFRNKRSKSILYLIPLFLLYGFIFYPQDQYLNSPGWLVFVGIFVTGGFLLSYGQYILSWESRHFDFIQASNISRIDFFKAKYYLIALPTIIFYFVTIPYAYFGREVLLINTMAFVYNLGINGPLLLFTASFNRKRMELDKGGGMNYQGVGINNFLVIIPLMALPAFAFALVARFTNVNIATSAFFIIGISGIIFHNFLIKKAVIFYEKNRYKISEGFRQQ